MPTRLYTRWEFNADLQRFKRRFNKTRSFENMVVAFFQNSRPECNIESFYTTGTRRKIDCFSVDGFCSHCNTTFQALGCFYQFCECQEGQPCLTDEDIVKGQRKRELYELLDLTCEKKITVSLRCGSVSGSFTYARIMR